MRAPTQTYKAMFPQPVPVPELGISLGPATLCHLAALDLLGCGLLAGDFGPAAAMAGAYVLSMPSGELERTLSGAGGADELRRGAAQWGLTLPVTASKPLRAAVARAVNEAFETAARPANPTKGDSPEAPASAGPSN